MIDMENVIRLLRTYTGNMPRQYYWRLTGSHKRTVRKHILEELTGVKVKSGKEGITVLEEELFKRFMAEGDCLAAKRDDLFIKMGA